MNVQNIGSFLKELRKEKGLTQEQLAEVFNVSSRSVSRWETGTTLPDISLLVEIAEYYDLDLEEIIDGKRKDTIMNEEVKQTVLKVADYAEVQKEKLLKNMRFFSIIGLVTFIIGMVIEGTALINNQTMDNIGSFAFGMAFASIFLNVLYTTGILLKVRQSNHKIMIKVLVVAITIIFVAFWIKILA